MEDGCFCLLPCADAEALWSSVSPWEPGKNYFFVIDCGSHEQKPHWLSYLVGLGACFSGGVLKVRVLDIVSNPFAPQGKTKVVSSFLIVLGCGWWWVWFRLSYPFQCGHSLTHLMRRNHSGRFWISFNGNCSMCSYSFCVSMGEGGFRSPLFHHLGTEPTHSFHSLLTFPIKLVPSQKSTPQ